MDDHESLPGKSLENKGEFFNESMRYKLVYLKFEQEQFGKKQPIITLKMTSLAPAVAQEVEWIFH